MSAQGLFVRAARFEDGPQVHDIMMAAFENSPREIWSAADVAEAFQTGDGAVVEKAGVLIGYCLVRKVLDEAEILSIAIMPGQRGQGAGSILLADTLVRLRNKKVLNVYLEVRENNKHAKNLYLKNGFVSIGKREGYYTLQNAPIENAIMYKHTIGSKID